MKLTCSQCQQQVQVDDAKIPAGNFKIKCPKCGKIISAQKDTSDVTAAAADAVAQVAASAGDLPPHVEAFVRREIAGLRKEILGSLNTLFGGNGKWLGEAPDGPDAVDTGKKALICEDDAAFVETISAVLRKLGYSFDVARTSSEAIKKVESGFYQLITVDYVFPDDKDGGHKIIAKINGQKPAQRRQQFVVLISSTVKSADANAAFFHGANITVNKEEIKNLDPLIREGLRHFQQLYSVFNHLTAEKNAQ